MNDDQIRRPAPVLCQGPAIDTARQAMARLTSTQHVELDQPPALQATAERWETAQGTKVSFMARHDRPMIDLVLRFRAGSALDGDHPGLAALTLYSLDQGTATLSAAQFAEHMAARGAIVGRSLSEEKATITLRCLSTPDLLRTVSQTLAQMLARPAFRPEDVAKIRDRIALYQGRQTLNPLVRLINTTTGHVFSGHPYASHADAAIIGPLTTDQVRAFHAKAYSANNLDIGLVGDLSRDDAEQLVNDLIRDLPQEWAAQLPPMLAAQSPLTRHMTHPGSATQAMLTVAIPVLPNDPVYAALELLTEILGGNYEARLPQELRQLRGLTYTVTTKLRHLDAGTLLHIHWDVDPQYREASQALVAGMLDCLHARGPTQVECDMAVNQIAARLHRELADSANLAATLATHSHQGLPADYLTTHLDRLASLTPAYLREVAQVWWRKAPQVFATLGPDAEQSPLPAPQSAQR
ncbi:M16 family metallopeptidase [Pseudomonas putida]|uniref:M16 family metallopeptidase n=1 Tax=Pseudomonas putida TaxID=303 RepID=UPI003570B667